MKQEENNVNHLKNKPASMSYRDWFIRQLSRKEMISESVVKAVITHQFDTANDAVKYNKSVEISGFGTFHLLQKKAEKELDLLKKTQETIETDLKILLSTSDYDETDKVSYENSLKNIALSIQALKDKGIV